ncbi:hypothetical protein EXIGLDRAFT_654806 [Exidia glandulosa HHB12029]|uniref:Pre-mRNA-splicing factor CWC26 n=1 Tax=Exidia glandulosa HHB12029 TaxID=1314781 RepID=A0A165DJ15_EXIGL|nr:hypothetical protein EXIGLDRAFT_654806 [Exidia glandulosa HHB12029]
MSSMKAYLAERYMSGPKADAILARAAPEKAKKKKRKATSSAPSTSLVKDDDAGFGDGPGGRDDDDLEEAVVEKSDRSFKKRKVAADADGAGWQTVSGPVKKEGDDDDAPLPDEMPQVVEEEAPKRGGLVTAAQFRAQQPQQQAVTRATSEERARQQEQTVYRDAAGRKIDAKAERAEAARRRREQEELEARKMEWGKGLVQRDEQERLRQELEKEKTRGMARYADDEDLNNDQRGQMRWNDPAAAFLTKKSGKGPRKPEYSGPPPPPNRFGIKPGYRWDGVDRGNGFEKKLFLRTNERRRVKDEAYSWSVDDM